MIHFHLHLRVSLDTGTLLEENLGKTFFDIYHSKIFHDPLSLGSKQK